MTKKQTDTLEQSKSSILEETLEKQSLVTRRMIGMHRGRTRRGRFFKIFSALTLFFALGGTTWWVLSAVKGSERSWSEFITSIANRITG
jgi:hypothetical protein